MSDELSNDTTVDIATDDVQVNLEVTSATTKAGIQTDANGVIASPTKKAGKPAPSIAVVNGAIGSPGASRKDPVKAIAEPKQRKKQLHCIQLEMFFGMGLEKLSVAITL